MQNSVKQFLRKILLAVMNKKIIRENLVKICRKSLINNKGIFCRAYPFEGDFEVHTKDNVKLNLYNNEFYLESKIFWLGINNFDWEEKEREIWVHLAKKSNVIFDIGANSGIYSILAKAYNSNSAVYSFEPQPNIFEILKRNKEINKFDITCERLAVSDKKGELPFYNYGNETFTKGNTTAGSLNKNWRPENQHSIMVEVTDLKSYIENNNITNIDLIKIDVETFEYEVLVGYGSYIQKHKPFIMLEIVSEELGRNIESLIGESDYSYFAIDNDKKILIKVNELGTSELNRNFLLCPNSKQSYIQNFIK